MPEMKPNAFARSISDSRRSLSLSMVHYESQYRKIFGGDTLNAPYRQGPKGINTLCQPTSVNESIARSQVGFIEGESTLPPLFFMALYAAKNILWVQENPR